MRKVIQIVAIPIEESLHALCDDGTIWEWHYFHKNGVSKWRWSIITPIPQDDEEKELKCAK